MTSLEPLAHPAVTHSANAMRAAARTPAVIIGADANGLGTIRSLGKAGVPVFVLDDDRWRPGMHSRYARPVVVRGMSGPALVDSLLTLRARLSHRSMLFMTSDAQVRTVSEYRSRLAGAFYLRLPDHSCVCKLLHKWSFHCIAERHGFPVPRTIAIRDENDIAGLGAIRFPAVVKPGTKELISSKRAPRACRVTSREQAEALCRQILPAAPDLIVQEWIEGAESDIYFCLQYRANDGVTVRSFTGRKLRSWPPQTGSTASCVAAPEVESILEPLTKGFFDAIGCVGMCSMEFKHDRQTGKFLMVEPTIGRTDWQEEVASLHGVSIPLAAYCYELELPLPATEKASDPVIWLDPPSYWRSKLVSKSFRDKRPARVRVKSACWRLDDPMPLAFFWLEWIQNLWSPAKWREMRFPRDGRLPDIGRAKAAPVIGGASRRKPLACVMGSMDLVRPLGLAGIRCAVVTRAGGAPRYSRFTDDVLFWEDFSEDAEQLVDALIHFGIGRPEPPVLFYEEDSQLLLVSRHRERLARAFRFVVADPVLVEDLVDKARFQILAERLRLPVPTMRRIHPVMGSRPADLDLRFPVVIKALMHRRPWDAIGCGSKALQVDSPAALRDLWPRLVGAGMDLVAQELIRGPETCIESYHVYVDQCGAIVGEFTGRKVRTYPPSYGHSTALVVSDATDVTELGRALVEQLTLRGVAKFDFKRGPDGRLHLLEVNPRFNLWHHLGAVAGVNLPALVYADLTGLPRPAPARARAGVRWCRIWEDLPAARAGGMSLGSWLSWVLRCEAKSAMAWDDPMPLMRGAMSRFFSRRSVATSPPHPTQPDPRARP